MTFFVLILWRHLTKVAVLSFLKCSFLFVSLILCLPEAFSTSLASHFQSLFLVPQPLMTSKGWSATGLASWLLLSSLSSLLLGYASNLNIIYMSMIPKLTSLPMPLPLTSLFLYLTAYLTSVFGSILLIQT